MRSSIYRSIVLFILFFALTPLTIATSIFSLFTLSDSKNVERIGNEQKPIKKYESGISVYASLPSTIPSILGVATASDARVEMIRQYLDKNNSPLEPFASKIVTAADFYNLDYRLITAIAQKESGLCKVIPPDSYNCWGWGVHSKGTLKFDSYDEAIATVTRGLKEYYIDKGYVTPEEIMSKYIPHSSSWAQDVQLYINEIDADIF